MPAGYASGLQWGTVPEWVTGVGTVGAFAFAAIVYYRDRRATHRERRMAQARQVDCWLHRAQWALTSDEDEEPPDWSIELTIALSNGSDQSVKAGTVGVQRGSTAERILISVGTIPPTAKGSPALRTTFLTPNDGEDVERLPSHLLQGMFRLHLSFIDTAGIWWDRDSSGHLTSRPAPKAPKSEHQG